MEKFIKLAVTGSGTETLSLSNVKMIIGDVSDNLTTVVYYYGGAVATLTHAEDLTYTLENQLQDAMELSYKKKWTNNSMEITPTVAVSSIAVS
tara:strand:+ start:465 stop:743 length:279 start_codon:yes stop_codon:yes gene_type:complete